MQKLKWFKQEKSYSCNAACLRMVLNYYGTNISEAELRKKTKTKPDVGSHPISILEAARSFDLSAHMSQYSLNDLELIVNQNIPAIVFILKTAIDFFYHHAVIVEPISQNLVVLLDPEQGRVETDLKTLNSPGTLRGI